ncbi:MAG: sensor histidine kinase [Pseudomonadota bacterium]
MPLIPMDPRTILFLLGVVYLLMSGLVWLVLRRHYDDGEAIALWCGGGVVIGATYLLFWLRPFIPPFWTIQLPTMLGLLGLGLRVCALLRERGQPERWRTAMPVFAGFVAVALAATLADDVSRRAVNGLLMAMAAIWLSVLARQVGRQPAGSGANLICASYAFFAVVLVLRMVVGVLGLTGKPAFAPTVDLLLVFTGGLVVAIFGNVGYMGLALDASRLRRDLQARALEQAQEQRVAAEAKAEVLADRLAEREEFVRVLAHEVRQPLNNASAALQGVQASLQSGAIEDLEEAQARLQRAQKVIGHIVGSLDNTLAATTVLATAQPLAPRDADVNMLVELSLGDLEPSQRGRVNVARSAHARTAAMDIGLMRLALRNLLANALAYSPAQSTVTLTVSDSDEPLGLVFEVKDRGPGLANALRARLFERGARGDHGLPGHGLGLHVVQQIMLRHGGQVGWSPNPGGGSVFRLWLPAT